MARISGIDIPRDKQVQISLTYIHGVGRTTAVEICEATGVAPTARVRDLTDDEVTHIRTYVDQNCKVEGFHPHDEPRDFLFEVCSHVVHDPALPFEVKDLRTP